MTVPEGFHVRLSSLEEFAATLASTQDDYDTLNGQLATAKLTDASVELLVTPGKLPGSTAVEEATRSTLTTYRTLYDKIAWAQQVIKAQLDTIATNITQTHQVYRNVEAKHTAMFRDLLETLPSDATYRSGGDNGSTGQG